MKKRIMVIAGLMMVVSNGGATILENRIGDEFNRADTVQAAHTMNVGGTGWTQADDGGSAGNDWFISSSALVVQARAGSARLYNTSLETQSGNGTNFILKADVRGLASNVWTGIIFNYTDEDNYYALRFKTGYKDYQLIRRTGTGLTALNSGTASGIFEVDVDYTLTVMSDAAGVFNFMIDKTGVGHMVLRCLVNNSGSALTGGYAGLYNVFTSSFPEARFDNFSLVVYPSFPVQLVDVGFESPVHIAYHVSEIAEGTIICDAICEDGETFYGVTQKFGTNRLWISETESYKGSQSLAATCYGVDTASKCRAEFRSVLGSKDYALRFGQEMYYGYAMKIDSNSTPSSMIIMQGYQDGCTSQVPVTLQYHHRDLESGDWIFLVYARTLTETRQISSSVRFSPGKWYKLVWRLRPEYPGSGETGLISLWVNDEKVVSWTGDWGHEPTGDKDQTLELRCGIYRAPSCAQQTIYYDQIRYADSYYEADPDADIEWGFHSGTDGWTVRKDIQDLVSANHCLEGTLSGIDCGLLSPDNLNLDCRTVSNITVRLQNSTASTKAGFFFTTTSEPNFSSDKQIDAEITANDSGYTVYHFNAASNAFWTGTLKQLRFDPANNNAISSGQFSIDFIDLCGGKAAWVYDNFDRADTGYSTNGYITGEGWVNSDGSSLSEINGSNLFLNVVDHTAILYNNKLQINTGRNPEFILNADVSPNILNGWVGAVFNYQNASNYYVLRVKAGTSAYQILKIENGAISLIMVNKSDALVTFNPGTPYTLFITSDTAGDFDFVITEAGGTSLLNPTMTAQDTSGTAFTGGYAGVYSPTASSVIPDAVFDNFYLEVGMDD